MKVTRTHRTTCSVDIEGIDVELEFDPASDYAILFERVNCTLVVAYLVHDDCPPNPMKEYDCMGSFYTRNGRVITDDTEELYRTLGLDNHGDVDIDAEFEAPEPWLDHNSILQVKTTLRDISADRYIEIVKGDLDLQSQFLEYTGVELVEGEDYQINLKELRRDLVDCNGLFSDEVEKLADEIFPEFWKRLADPYAVPARYDDYRSGGTQIGTATWDGDVDDVPNAVWVADAAAQENLPAPGDADFERRVTEYATSVLSEYESWCNGDVYGCVVETYKLEAPADVEDLPTALEYGLGRWEQTEHDSVWCFIGYDYALKTLKEDFFNPTLSKLKSAVQAEA